MISSRALRWLSNAADLQMPGDQAIPQACRDSTDGEYLCARTIAPTTKMLNSRLQKTIPQWLSQTLGESHPRLRLLTGMLIAGVVGNIEIIEQISRNRSRGYAEFACAGPW